MHLLYRPWLLVIGAALFLPAVLAAQSYTDEFGGMDNMLTGSGAFKLNAYRIEQLNCVRLDEYEVYLGGQVDEQLHFVIYRKNPLDTESWLLEYSETRNFNADETGFVMSPAVNRPLFEGDIYAIGVYLLPSELDYYSNSNLGTAVVNWGELLGSVWSDNNSSAVVADPIAGPVDETLAYWQRISVTVIDDCDGDGYDVPEDCDDTAPSVNPNGIEVCDGIDQNCDGVIDEGVTTAYYTDFDADGFGSDETRVDLCEKELGLIDQGGDCDDKDSDINPAAWEAPCGDADRNCDGVMGDEAVCAEADQIQLGANCGCSSVDERSGGASILVLFLIPGLVRRALHS